MSVLSKEVKIALITIASSLGGAIPGGIAGIAAGAQYIKSVDLNKKISAFKTVQYGIFPACVVTGAVIGGTIGYFVSQPSEDEEEQAEEETGPAAAQAAQEETAEANIRI
jgi:hypothetical protein